MDLFVDNIRNHNVIHVTRSIVQKLHEYMLSIYKMLSESS